jgi:NAD(P)-dependent dehydrogenase (short-subunit alcohol dehydrogenase family)
MNEFENKTFIITGATSGIGEAISKHLDALGHRCVLIGRNPERGQALETTLENSTWIQVDLADKNSPHILKRALAKLNLSKVDGLVNCAGAFSRQSFSSDGYLSHFDEQIVANLHTTINATHGCLDLLKSAKGKILNVSSTVGLRPVPGTSAYSASKAALINLTQSMALELAEFGVAVNVLCPGIIESPIHDFFHLSKAEKEETRKQLAGLQPMGRIGQYEDILPWVETAMLHSSNWTTGATITVDGGINL